MPLLRFTFLTSLLCVALGFSGAAFAAGGTDALPFRNTALPLEKRVDDLISRLSVDEKIGLTMMANPDIPRLDIPSFDWWNEALHGVARSGTATVFPQAIAMAATWNTPLVGRIADTISTEARAKNNELISQGPGHTKRYQGLTIWSPNINIFRDPRWGRGQETYGEDPCLTGRMGVAFVKGLQGSDPKHLKTVATLKHYAVHSGPEPLRHSFDVAPGERDLRETYLPAFEIGIREGRASSVMSAYNAVYGVPAPANEQLLQKILRDEWGFDGAVVGDVDNVADMWRPKAHLFSPDAAAASATAIKAGNDLCSGKTYAALTDALKRGLVTEADIDKALRRLLTLRFRLGHFDPAANVSYRSIPPSANNSPANDRLALEAARQSLVLLKNDGTLPFAISSMKKVAILGPTGTEESALLGNYNGEPGKKITLVEGIKNKLQAKGIQVVYEPGVPIVKGFRVGGQPFPAGVLFTDATRTRPGLKAEVFSHRKQDRKNPAVDGEVASSRTDAQIDLQWDETQPVEGIPIENSAIRWTGVIVPAVTGEYTLGARIEGAFRVQLNGERIINEWGRGPERPASAVVHLDKGKTYDITIEFVQLSRKALVQFGWIAPGKDDGLDRALAAARAADHIILTLGITPDLEGESMSVNAEGFEGGDRTSIDLPETQRELLEQVAALKKPTAIVLTTGSALSLDDSKAGAILLAWYYGQRGADAVAEAIIGETNPAGRLPITFYRDLKGLPDFKDYAMTNRTYRYYTGKPLYAFGHGLSYTTFAYQNLALSSRSLRDGDTISLKATVKNTGTREGDEVVQVYATSLNSPVSMPIRQLVDFRRVAFKAGETQTLTFEIPVNRLRRWDDKAHRYLVDPGSYRLTVGPASDQPALQAELNVSAAR
jgi:beta-glucosidase